METITIIKTTVGLLAQVALFIKGAKTILDEYGDDAIQIGKSVFGFVKDRFDANEETKGEIEYFVAMPEQKKRQQVVADSLTIFVEQNEAFRKELEQLLNRYKEVVPAVVVEESVDSAKVAVNIGGDVTRSQVYTAAHDITIGDDN